MCWNLICTIVKHNLDAYFVYVDLGLLPIKNIDLPEKTGRKKKSTIVRKNKRVFGNSIEERPKEIEKRNEFGHWEIDTVVGTKDESEPSILTIVERQTRMSLWFKIKAHTSEAVTEALNKLVQSFADKAALIFKTIKGDNGSEFAQIAELEGKGLQIYFTYPYSSWEKGTNECHNKMLRRFIPKGKAISDYSADDILFFSDIINNLPRKILNYQTPEQLFEQQLDLIYAV
ncbi:IS30 family transposase [Ruminococcus sp.]|uniref:IS30 family transposase n=2 Tax=Ruminococcus sp. TaxID=41978 RepID=UPI0025DE1861|nr:IS30 family transposase [Ruminococcus sp.]